MTSEVLKSGHGEHHEHENPEHHQDQLQDDDVAKAMAELRRAEAEVERAIAVLTQAEENVKKATHDLEKAEHEQRNKLLVSACTTAGFWPAHGFLKVSIDQAIGVFLTEAKRELKIPDVTGWVARVGDRVLNVSQSYRENGLVAGSEAVIDWGPDHGGGGADA